MTIYINNKKYSERQKFLKRKWCGHICIYIFKRYIHTWMSKTQKTVGGPYGTRVLLDLTEEPPAATVDQKGPKANRPFFPLYNFFPSSNMTVYILYTISIVITIRYILVVAPSPVRVHITYMYIFSI